jgi:hypothetical protein
VILKNGIEQQPLHSLNGRIQTISHEPEASEVASSSIVASESWCFATAMTGTLTVGEIVASYHGIPRLG